jgi:hypothetical protein
MDEIELGVLEACREYANRQLEMLPKLAATLGVEQSRVFYTWAGRRCAQSGRLVETDWAYFFHGLECDLRNQRDGRVLRMDFGPKGRVGILDSYGVLRFIMASVPPWREFPNLRTYFAKGVPPFGEHSGSAEKLSHVWARLEGRGCFEAADPGLVGLQAKYTTRGSDGLSYVHFPSEISEETRADCSVAHRQQLSSKAIDFLTRNPLNGTSGVESPADAKVRAVTA